MISIEQVEVSLYAVQIAEGWANIGQQSGPWFVDTVR